MIHLEAALQKQLLDVAIAQRIAQIPAHCLKDQRGFKLTPLEIVLGLTFQPFGNRIQDHEVPPNRRVKSTAAPDEPSTPKVCDRPLPDAAAGEIIVGATMRTRWY